MTLKHKYYKVDLYKKSCILTHFVLYITIKLPNVLFPIKYVTICYSLKVGLNRAAIFHINKTCFLFFIYIYIGLCKG